MSSPDPGQQQEAIDVARHLAARFGQVIEAMERDRKASEERDEALATANAATAKAGRLNRIMVLITWAGGVVDIALTIVVAVFAFQAHAADDNATAAHAAARAARVAAADARTIARLADHDSKALCLSSNVARAQQIGLWDYLISLSTGPRTEAEQKLLAKFEHHLRAIYAPRDCDHLTPGNP